MLELQSLDKKNLAEAFTTFTQMSQQLADSYQSLEAQVADLHGELETVSLDRMQELAEKERLADYLSSLLSILPVGVIVLDKAGLVKECNSRAVSLLGEPLLNQEWLVILERSFAPRSDDGHEVSLRDGKRISVQTCALENDKGQLLVLHDLTETRQLQETVARHQRLSEMGEMSASLAHQIRTPLATALIYANHLKAEVLDQEKREHFSSTLINRLKHLETLVKDMMMFARGNNGVQASIELKELLSLLKKSCEIELSESNSHLNISNQVGDVKLYINIDGLLGALQNLITNAIQAKQGNVNVDLLITSVTQTNKIQIKLIDDGPGMTAEILQRVTEPFFTTRSQGTGLGLAIVDAMVKAHGGDMKIDSTVGEGTQIMINLPVMKEMNHETA